MSVPRYERSFISQKDKAIASITSDVKRLCSDLQGVLTAGSDDPRAFASPMHSQYEGSIKERARKILETIEASNLWKDVVDVCSSYSKGSGLKFMTQFKLGDTQYDIFLDPKNYKFTAFPEGTRGVRKFEW